VFEAVEAAATRREHAGAEFRPAAAAAKARCHTRVLLSLDQSARRAVARCQ
jgi:hypothetical protein